MTPDEILAFKSLNCFNWLEHRAMIGKAGDRVCHVELHTGWYENGRGAIQVLLDHELDHVLTVNLVDVPLAPWHIHVKCEGLRPSLAELTRRGITNESPIDENPAEEQNLRRIVLARLRNLGLLSGELPIDRIRQGFVQEYATTFALCLDGFRKRWPDRAWSTPVDV